MDNLHSRAIVPYSPPVSSLDFVKSEFEKGVREGTITGMDVVKAIEKRAIASPRPRRMLGTLGMLRTLGMPDDIKHPVVTRPWSDAVKIAVACDCEAAFTRSTDKKPIVEACCIGSPFHITLGGYDDTNKIAFVANFLRAEQIREGGGAEVLYSLGRLVKNKINTPIQLHLRGGPESQVETIAPVIRAWMKTRSDLPMELASEGVINSALLSIDSRNGEVSNYSTSEHSHNLCKLSELKKLTHFYYDKISVVYRPEE